MYVVEITTDKLFKTLTTEDTSDQNHTQVGRHGLTYFQHVRQDPFTALP